MDWDLVRAQSGVAIRRISNRDAFSIGHSRGILELLLGLMKQEFPTGEIPKQAATFISRFMKIKGEFPNLIFGHQDGCTRQQPLGRRKWSALSSRNWRNRWFSADCIKLSWPCTTESPRVIITSF